jgi:ubiquinone/menaquinone biosynthesis C-methylase UbiE
MGAGAVKSKELFPAIFSRHAAAYARRLDQIMARGEARGRQRVIDLVDARPGMEVLDLACGPGTLSRRLAPLVAPDGHVVGIDLAPGMVEIARSAAAQNTRFEVMDMEELTFSDASFDAAVCGHGLQFAPHLDRALREVRRVLRNSSAFAASVPVTPVKESIWALLDEVIDRWLPPPPRAIDQDATRATVGDAAAFSAATLAAGFESARVEVIDERVVWESADQLVSLCTSWWDCAARLDGVDAAMRLRFIEDATETLRREHPGAIETTGRNHVLFAIA